MDCKLKLLNRDNFVHVQNCKQAKINRGEP